ncbi:MAG TPA: archaellin/type IV pilin N-terminal domain-containing protein [Thermoplasmata archaeon]|nr:archaellin/type IV pilin N-terminal domain-containing protein [Thermoplasmata archaeon]
MNVIGEKRNGWRKGRKRGVSPIIATILLVAITVVLAAVLYVLVSGLTHTSVSTPYSLGLTTPTASNPGTNTYWEVIPISPTGGVTTAMFGLTVLNINKIGITAQAPTANCKKGNALSFADCGAPTAAGWYVALVYESNSTIANTYQTSWSAATIALNAGMEVVVVSYTSYAATGDTLNAVSTGSSSVSGSVAL